ncbi:putative HTH-type transcriptional regulator YdfH [Roseovarius sp. A-2]|uniref:GntR family transcriptional regulator n=1 Tax=Roseovarius sp. A-2 TaxID=1570360 RepID=UPI0009B56404|nr:GntR family transcriptional regulator [Roseovarius sp. A-2]GAW34184.1 putative HTH-type transcriptional regulator YdfH [Roseovarius sp. A-2]
MHEVSREIQPASSSATRPIKRGSASTQIHNALRDRIVALEFTPGEFLSRAEIAAYYGVSQTPVRDAMMRLEEEGLLIIYPQSKTLVSKIDVAHAQEAQFLRLSIELEVTRRLAQAKASDRITKAHTCLSLQRVSAAANDLDEFSRLDRAFHAALYDAVGVANLWNTVTARSGHIDRLRNLNLPDPGKSTSILSCHERILAAIDAGDTGTVEAVVREHLSGTLAQVDRIMERNPEYF